MLRLVLSLLLIATAARAEDTSERAIVFEQMFEGWLASVGATEGVLALRYNGEPVATWSRGRDATDPVALASLSKAITGACVASLVDDGLLSYDQPARDILDLPEAAPVTIGQLLSHASGLHKDYTQGPMAAWKDDPTPRWAELTPRALEPGRLAEGGTYHYSNENYAVLGTVIEKVTGMPYEHVCRTRVIDPAGVQGGGSDRFAAYLPWGCWQMTAADFGGFVDYAFGPQGILTDRLGDLPSVVIDGPVRYGMGMLQREMDVGRNVWHFGALCFFDGPDLGAYAVHWRNGWTVTAWYNACVTWPDMAALDAAMAGVAYGVQ